MPCRRSIGAVPRERILRRVRNRSVAGMHGMGPTVFQGGIAGEAFQSVVCFGGGAPERPEAVCGSGSGFHSAIPMLSGELSYTGDAGERIRRAERLPRW